MTGARRVYCAGLAGLIGGWLLALPGAPDARADPLPRDRVPEPLQPWIDWVLRDVPEATCPYVIAEPRDARACFWISRLALVLEDQGGAFRQEVAAFRDGSVPLPGSSALWPEEVQVDGKAAAVVLRDGAPSVRVGPGRHRVLGRLRWSALPESLEIPAQTGLASLKLRGSDVPFPARPEAGRLWLGSAERAPTEADAVDVTVHRRLIDGVPVQLDTRLLLQVSGRNRELAFDTVLPPGFSPVSLSSPLPARIEASGALRVQTEAGRFELRVLARSDARDAASGYPEVQGPWDPSEVWVFEAAPALRRVDVEGARAIDPQQTELPPDLQQLPTYLVEPGTTLRLVEQQRTGSEPIPDQLRLDRTLWLDFDGAGYSLRDAVSGALARSWRLEMQERVRLGRVAIDGQDQPITRRVEDGPDGVELRGGALQLEADARLEGRGPVPAVGWNGDFDGAGAELRLPPGWTALHVSGPDAVRGSWIDGWTLLSIFVVLITALAASQLWGWTFGALALATLVLVYPEAGAPRFVWLLPLALQALARVAPEGRLQTGLVSARVVAALLLAWIAIPFGIQQARQGLHPALETPTSRALESSEFELAEDLALPSSPSPTLVDEEGVVLQDSPEQRRSPAKMMRRRVFAAPPGLDSVATATPEPLDRPDPDALVSTGPGIPTWRWRAVALEWSGPVTQGETFRPWLLPPLANRALCWIRVGLMGALAVLVLLGPGPFRRLGRSGSGGATPAAAALALAVAIGGLPATSLAQLPSTDQLEELRQRLTAPPDCLPDCASIARMRIEVEPDQLRARLDVDVAWSSAVPLPGSLDGFVPTQVTVDADAAPPLVRAAGGTLRVQLEPGRHQVFVVGALPAVDALALALPLPPRQIEIEARGWSVSGVRADGRPTSSLELLRQTATPPSTGEDPPVAPDTSAGSELVPFVRVERRLQLGLRWRAETRVVRLSPPGRPLVLRVPLLAGESVTSTSVDVQDGAASITLAPQVQSVGWESRLEPGDEIRLTAPSELTRVERWSLDASAVWHLELTGIPPIGAARQRVREWWPWPGETATIAVTRPDAAPGQSVTFDRTELRVSPGARSSDVELELQVRASRAERRSITLADDAELQGVEVDGRAEPLRLFEGRLELPLRPGAQQVIVRWRSEGPRGLLYSTPAFDLGGPSVNVATELTLPDERWVLLTGGPLLGPSVLFWSLLAVSALLAFGLGRVPLTPLGAGAWLLLFVGLTQVHVVLASVVVLWLVALGARQACPPAGRLAFNATQIGLGLLTLLALAILLVAVQVGLLGSPDMQIRGNGSSGSRLVWYQDRADATPDAGWVLWVPLWVYRAAMLAWALWLARALLRWLRWGWACFSQEGLWRARAEPSGEIEAPPHA